MSNLNYNLIEKNIRSYFEKNTIFDNECKKILSFDIQQKKSNNGFIIYISIDYHKNDSFIYNIETNVKIAKSSDIFIFRNNGVISTSLMLFNKSCSFLQEDFINIYKIFTNL